MDALLVPEEALLVIDAEHVGFAALALLAPFDAVKFLLVDPLGSTRQTKDVSNHDFGLSCVN